LLVPSVCETCFVTNSGTIILLTNTTLKRLGFEETAIEQSHETEDMLVCKSNPAGFSYAVNIFAGLRCIFCTHKSRPATWNYTFPPLIYSAESSVDLGRREEGTQNVACKYSRLSFAPATTCETRRSLSSRFAHSSGSEWETAVFAGYTKRSQNYSFPFMPKVVQISLRQVCKVNKSHQHYFQTEKKPFWNNNGNNQILPIPLLRSLHLLRTPEMVASRVSCFRPLVKKKIGQKNSWNEIGRNFHTPRNTQKRIRWGRNMATLGIGCLNFTPSRLSKMIGDPLFSFHW